MYFNPGGIRNCGKWEPEKTEKESDLSGRRAWRCNAAPAESQKKGVNCLHQQVSKGLPLEEGENMQIRDSPRS